MKCHICGNDHDTTFKCPWIKAYEYYNEPDEDGHVVVKRVEFVTFADFPRDPDRSLLSLPTHSTRQ